VVRLLVERGAHQRDVVRADASRECRRRAGRSVLEQVPRDVVVPAADGHAEGGHAVERVFRVHVGAALDEEPHHVEAPLVGGEEQRGRAVARPGVDVHAGVEERRDLGAIAAARGVPQRLRLGGRLLRGQGECGDERPNEGCDRHVHILTGNRRPPARA